MIRKLGIVVVGLCMAFAFVLKANAEQAAVSSPNPQKQQLGAKHEAMEQQRQALRQEIEFIPPKTQKALLA